MERSTRLEGKAVQELLEAILDAFPARSDLARMVRIGLSQNLEAITSPGTLQSTVFELISWAESNGKLDDLRAAASTRASDFDDLLDPGTAPPPANPRPAALLDARYRFVPFFERGRADLLADLGAWCAADKPVGMRLFLGPGGTGKTRLFIEWCERLWERGWTAGFLFKNVNPDRFEALLASPRPTLIVIDYAESRPRLSELLEAVARRRTGRKAPLRIVLLARSIGDWWSDLRTQERAVRDLVDESLPVELSPLTEAGPERAGLFQEAVARLAAVRGRPVPTTPPPSLEDRLYGRVLYLHMAALALVDGVPVVVGELVDGVLDHEERFWMDQAPLTSRGDREKTLYRERIRRSVAAATLLGGISSREQTAALLQRLHGQTDELLLLFLHELYPGRRLGAALPAFVGALEPDLLGEAMVRRVLSREGEGASDILNRVFAGAEERAIRAGLEVLGRLSTEISDEAGTWISCVIEADLNGRAVAALAAAKSVGERTAHSILGLRLALALESRGDIKIALRLEESGIPETTVSMREVAAWVVSMKVASLSRAKDPDGCAMRGRFLSDLGVRQEGLGRHSEALASLQKAERQFRALVKTHPEHRANLAFVLRNRVGSLMSSGRREDALRSAKEAVDIYRALVASQPGELESELAKSLNNLALALGSLGQRSAALDAMVESSDIFRALSGQESEEDLRPVLAHLLSNLSKLQSDLGLREAALASAQESVTIRRVLALMAPDAYVPDLADGLVNLGKMLLALGRHREALERTRQAVEHLRALAGARPDVFLPKLALSLNNLGQMERSLGHDRAALEAIEEAVRIFRRLAHERPSLFLADLGMGLINLGHVHLTFGRREAAVAAGRESVQCYREANAGHPSTYRADLALSLNNLAHMASAVGDHEAALASAEEAMAHYRALNVDQPEAFRQELALSLTSISRLRTKVGKQAIAVEPARAAVALYEELMKGQPGAFQHELARSLMAIGGAQQAMGEHAAAAQTLQDALDIARALFERSAEVFQPEMIGLLLALTSTLMELDRWQEAYAAALENVGHCRSVALTQPEEYTPELAICLSNLGKSLRGLGRHDEALAPLQEACEIISPFAESAPARFGVIAATMANNLQLCRDELALSSSPGPAPVG